MTTHAYLPTTLISDKDTAFMSHVIKEVDCVHGIYIKHTTTKHAQTIGPLEWSQASIKQTLKIETGERRSLWPKYVSIAFLKYNNSYHTSNGCEPSRVFHGPITSWIENWEFFHNNSPFPLRKLLKTFLIKQKWSPPRCWQKCHASLHQIKSILRQKGQRFNAQRSKLRLLFTAESGSSRE